MAVNGVFEAGIFAYGAVAVVALDRNGLLCQINHLLRTAEANHPSKLRIGACVAMGHPHAAANRDIEPGKLAVFQNGDKTKVLGEHIHIIGRRDCEADFELARQVDRAIDRLHLYSLFAVHYLFTVQPDFMVGWRARRQMITDPARPLVDLGMHLGLVRIGAAHHIAVNVPAGSEGGHQRVVYGFDRFFQIPLEYTVHLKSLSGSQPQGAVAVFMGQLIHDQPLGRGCHTARCHNPQHELKGRLQLRAFPFTAQIPVILHVAAVELKQPVVIFRKAPGDRVAQRFDKRSPQIVALQLNMFNIAWRSADRLHR
ncbi:hypothetical protein D3C75_715430 [compost metagenome]